MSFDLDKIQIEEEGAEMVVVHPVTFEPLKDENGGTATLRLIGMDSALYRKTSNAIINKRTKSNRGGRLNAERIEADSLDLICKCTLSWSNITAGGEVPKTAEELYEGRKWLREQADAFIHDRANYLGN